MLHVPVANLFTLAQTCRANGVAPLAYFENLYEHLPLATAELEALLKAASRYTTWPPYPFASHKLPSITSTWFPRRLQPARMWPRIGEIFM